MTTKTKRPAKNEVAQWRKVATKACAREMLAERTAIVSYEQSR